MDLVRLNIYFDHGVISLTETISHIPSMKFGNRGSLEQHGFARNRMWLIDDNPPPLQSSEPDTAANVDLLFKPSDDDLRI